MIRVGAVHSAKACVTVSGRQHRLRFLGLRPVSHSFYLFFTFI